MSLTVTPFETIIGIECHVQLATASKMFCGCSATWFGAPPNTVTCPVCLGLPGALPVPNRRAVELSIAAGIALHCETPTHTKFDRKNYLYPDLPKGYQISQFDLPLSVGGWIEIPADGGGTKRVAIRRAHLEEDTGSLLHVRGATLVDFNRSGVPLLEIVSEPDLRSSREALAYLEALRETIVYAGVAGFRLEEGGARFDVNVSIRFSEAGETRWPPLSEIKNLNSFRALEGAVAFETARLWREWQDGGDLRRRTEGGGQRLPVLPRARSRRSCAGPRDGRTHPRHTPGDASGTTCPIRDRPRTVGVRRPRPGVRPEARGLVRSRGRRRRW